MPNHKPACKGKASFFLLDRRAASLVGYGLIIGLISVLALGAIGGVGDSVSSLFGITSDRMDAAGSGSSGGGGADTEPDAFDFTNEADQAASTTVLSSDILQITGHAGVTVTVSGDASAQFRICQDSACSTVLHAFGAASQTIENGEYLQLSVTSNAASGGSVTVTVDAGGTSDTWSVTTQSIDGNAYLVRDNIADGTGPHPPAGDWVLRAVSSETAVTNGATYLAACQVFGLAIPSSTESNLACNTALPSPQITVTDECNMARDFAFEDSVWLQDFPGGRVIVLYTSSSRQEFFCPAGTTGNFTNCTLGTLSSGQVLDPGDYIACAQLR